VDYHQRTAEMIAQQAWGIAPELVQSKHRSEAKTVNFGLLYGMADKSLAAQLGISQARAGKIREAVLGNFKVLDRWCKEQLRNARRTGETWTWWDGQRYRRRALHRVADVDSETRSRAEHASWNTPVQGTASDFCVMSLTECVRWIVEDGLEDDVKLVLAVHDSLMFDVREAMVPELLATAHDIMTSWPSVGVPLVVDAKMGRSWGSLEDVAIGEAA
jgi:DNA polymerase-1